MLACISRAMRCRSPMFFMSLDLQDAIWPAEGLEGRAEHRILCRRLRVGRRRRRLLHAADADSCAKDVGEVALELGPLLVAPDVAREVVAERDDDGPALDRDRLRLHQLRGLRDAALLGPLEEALPGGAHALQRDRR